MSPKLQTVIYPVDDLGPAKAMFAALLGVDPVMDEPYYVGFEADGHHVGLDPNGHRKGLTMPVPYWHVDDIRESVAALVAAGAQVKQDVEGVGGDRLVASVTDADGNLIGLIQG